MNEYLRLELGVLSQSSHLRCLNHCSGLCLRNVPVEKKHTISTEWPEDETITQHQSGTFKRCFKG